MVPIMVIVVILALVELPRPPVTTTDATAPPP